MDLTPAQIDDRAAGFDDGWDAARVHYLSELAERLSTLLRAAASGSGIDDAAASLWAALDN
jgi:hypothetical protein